MAHTAIAFLGFIAIASSAHGADTVVLGKGISNSFVSELTCPEGAICMDSLYRWELNAKHTVAGPIVAGRLRAVISQHADANIRFVKSVELFVLRPIEDRELGAAYGADFELVALSPRYANGNYCLSVEPEDVGLKLPASEVSIDPDSGYRCFSSKLIRH